ncbi:MAG: FAD-dependent oxidoreductase, partial [Candidatus Hydrothermarchaeales archaeon]
MKVWETNFIGKIERAEGTMSFRFKRPSDFSYLPGQYFFVEVEGADGRRLVHHFSFSSSPTNHDFVEFTTRIRESEFKQTIDNLPVGTRVFLSEIHGEFTLNPSMKKVVFLCGGIGITAAFSNILWAAETKEDVDIILLYANRNQAAIAFRDELDALTGG